MAIQERFAAKVDRTLACWEWTAAKSSNGYGAFWLHGKMVSAHRASYEMHVGPIPDGLTLDHLCRNRGCVRPDHLEPVATGVNVLRGISFSALNAKKTHCPRGHEYTPENTKLGRNKYSVLRGCRACCRLRARLYRNARLREKVGQ